MTRLKINKYILTLVSILLCTGLYSFLWFEPVYATPSYQINNSIIDVSIKPGQTITSKITIEDVSSDASIDMKVETAGLGQSQDGGNLALPASQDLSPFSARTFCSIDKTSIHLEPGYSQEIKVTIKIPENIQNGEYYAAIYIYTQPTEQDRIGVRLASIIPVILKVGNFTTSAITGQITDLSIPQATAGKSVEIDTTLKNTGDSRLYTAKNTVTLYNASGIQISQSVIQLTPPSILPTCSRTFKAFFSSLAAGNYTVKSQITINNDSSLDSKTASFMVTQASPTPTSDSVPTISSFSPGSGGPSTSVVITGTNFTNASSVGFGGVAAQSFIINTENQITAVVGNGATGVISVTTPGGTAASATYFNFISPTPTPTPSPSVTPSPTPSVTTSFTTTPSMSTTAPAPLPTRKNKYKPSTGEQETDNIEDKALPGMDPTSLVIMRFNNQLDPYLNAIEKDNTEVMITGTYESGSIIVGKYSTLPDVIAFSAPVRQGGTGKIDIKYVDVRVEGFKQGTARISIHYTDEEIKSFDINSLFLAYYHDDKWNICRNNENDINEYKVSGDIPVIRLNGTLIGLGGDYSSSFTVNGQYTQGRQPGNSISWALVGIITGSIVIVCVIVIALVENQRRSQRYRA